MAQPALHLIIGNYNTSSWSLRAWLALRLARLAFDETRIPLREETTPGRIAEFSPSGKLPVLLAEGVPIWDSLAIAEFVAELEPSIWPIDPIARAEARSVAAEMHSGFAELRRLMPMDIIGRFGMPGRLPRGLAADIARIKTVWQHCRSRFAADGPFLFGAFSIADAMMAPVATRFVTHGVPIDGLVEEYVDSVMGWPDMASWCDAASAEQEERAGSGQLAVRRTSREGRIPGAAATDDSAGAAAVLSSPAAATEIPSQASPPVSETPPPASAPQPAAAIPEAETLTAPASADDLPAESVAADETPAPAMATAAATEQSTISASGSSELPAGAAIAGREPEGAHQREASNEPDALPDVAGAAPAPRKRLFESAPAAPLPTADEPSIPAPQRAKEAADDPAPPSRAGFTSGMAKLGWIRRPVPTDTLPEAPFPENRQLRRPTAGRDADPHGKEPSTTKHSTDASAANASEGAQPQPTQHQGQGRPPIGRSAGPAIKPIGGGILRRR